MRKFVVAFALVSTALAGPALARDNSFYVGIEGGGMIVENAELNYRDNGVFGRIDRAYTLRHHPGIDVDLIAGYDLGLLRVEGELGYKHAAIDDVEISPFIQSGLVDPFLDASGHRRALSVMGNALLDFGGMDGWHGYVGGGVGVARVTTNFDVPGIGRHFNGTRGRVAWQAIAGVRKEITPNLDLGVKYRFFNVNRVNYDVDGGPIPHRINSRWRSHSLLLSLIYNFAAPPVVLPPPPPPPPAPPPPATRTCPDGTVVLATEPCPAPPPPPPPPPPAPERG